MNKHHNQIFSFITSVLLLFSSTNDLTANSLSDGPGKSEKGTRGLRAFSIHDVNNDGLLSKEEYQNFVQHRQDRRKSKGKSGKGRLASLSFEEIDSSADGYIDEDEMISALNRRLHKHRRYRYKTGKW